MLRAESFLALSALTVICPLDFSLASIEAALAIFFYNSIEEGHLVLRILILLGFLLLRLFLRFCLLLLVLANWL